MPAKDPSLADEDAIAYNLQIHENDWRDWKQTVPRDTALWSRLYTLIEYDTRHNLDELVLQDAELDVGDGDDVSVTMMRIRHRCMSAVQDARENGAGEAAEALAEIQGMATGVLEDGE